jgi:energy-converting hydrogenase Eha subunit E
LSTEETAALLYMREEEKLARDVYNALYAIWGQPIFQNIAASEQSHMDAILTLIDRYGLTDPAQAEPGIFTDPNLQVLYDALIARGGQSLSESYYVGGAIEESAKGEDSIIAVMPAMLVVVLTLLMIQLQSFQKTMMVLLTSPLGLIGVVFILLTWNVPFGFVANLGVIALFGMIMRNSVILVDQIEQDISAGRPEWEAIVEATVRRFRPIVLTAAAAVLAMIPLSRSNFWGPMAVAIMGGLISATVLTLLFVPALYAAWFRVKRPG